MGEGGIADITWLLGFELYNIINVICYITMSSANNVLYLVSCIVYRVI